MPTNININLTASVEGGDAADKDALKRDLPAIKAASPWRVPHDVGICTVAAPARNALTPGLGKFRPYRYFPNPKNRFIASAYGDQYFLNWTNDPVAINDEVHVDYLDRARIWSLGQPSGLHKVRNCFKGEPVEPIPPGEGGLLQNPVCLWGNPPYSGQIPVLNCTQITLQPGNNYEACFNCECKYVVTNCCPLMIAQCPNCQYACADNYDIILPTFPESCMACLSGTVLPLSRDSDCLYIDNGGVEQTACIPPDWDMIDSNPCECGPTPVDPFEACVVPPDLTETWGDDCRNCTGDTSTLCAYCKANCYFGIRKVNGYLDCVLGNWVLNISGGSPDVCPNRSWSAVNTILYEAHGNCPPRSMILDFNVVDSCTQSADLQCAVSAFSLPVQLIPRNN